MEQGSGGEEQGSRREEQGRVGGRLEARQGIVAACKSSPLGEGCKWDGPRFIHLHFGVGVRYFKLHIFICIPPLLCHIHLDDT